METVLVIQNPHRRPPARRPSSLPPSHLHQPHPPHTPLPPLPSECPLYAVDPGFLPYPAKPYYTPADKAEWKLPYGSCRDPLAVAAVGAATTRFVAQGVTAKPDIHPGEWGSGGVCGAGCGPPAGNTEEKKKTREREGVGDRARYWWPRPLSFLPLTHAQRHPHPHPPPSAFYTGLPPPFTDGCQWLASSTNPPPGFLDGFNAIYQHGVDAAHGWADAHGYCARGDN